MTPVPPCNPGSGGSCELVQDVETGLAFFVVSEDDFCAKRLSGNGLAMVQGGAASMRNGSASRPISLPDLTKVNSDAEFKNLMIMDGSGQVHALKPSDAEAPQAVLTANGVFFQGDLYPTVCYKGTDICGNCDNAFVAGFRQNDDGTLCLTKIEFDAFTSSVDSWEDTQTIDISGSGTPANKYKAVVRISPTAGNIISQNAGGLLALIPISQQVGNRLQMLADGLYVTDLPEYS